MAVIHFLNVLEGDCNIIQHESGNVSVIDISNAYNDEDSEEEREVKNYKEGIKHFTNVPEGKKDFKQKENPDNPIEYLQKINVNSIMRFIITHPDMDHLDGIEDLYKEFTIVNTWDTDNTKEGNKNPSGGRYNKNDWNFYTQIRDGKYKGTKRLTLFDGSRGDYYTSDNIKILCPTPELVKQANESTGDYHDLSYVLLFTPPKKDGGRWKIIFSGDSHDASWEYIIKKHANELKDIDILFAPHHGRDSTRNYDFLETLSPKITLFGNASSEHLAYDKYNDVRITNNQAGYIVMDINEDRIEICVKNKEFADWFRNNKGRDWGEAPFSRDHDAYVLGQINA